MQHEPFHYSISPLPVRVIRMEWEDLPSLIMRTAAQMHYRNPLWVVRPQEEDYEIGARNLCLLRDRTDYQNLGKLLALDEEALYQCTYHSFAPRLLSPENLRENLQRRSIEELGRPLFSYGSALEIFQAYSTARVCPRCLSEGIPHGRLYWNFRALVICPSHHTFLIHRCPHCHKTIPTLRSSLTHCPYCKIGDYRQAREVAAANDPFFLFGQTLIMAHLTGENAERDKEMENFAESPLLTLTSWDYFLLLRAFLNVMSDLFPNSPFLRVTPEIRSQLRPKTEINNAFSSYEWAALIATFHYVFAAWPKHFFDFWDVLQSSRTKGEIVSYEKRDLGNFGSAWIYKKLSGPTFFFLREAYETYLRASYRGESRLPPRERFCMTIEHARETLGVFQDEFETLINLGLLSVVRVRVQNRIMNSRIEREGVERLCREWEGLISLYKVAYSLLDAEVDTVRMLCEKGWLAPTKGPSIDGYFIEMYSATNVNAFVSALLSRASSAPRVAGESISLRALSISGMMPLGSVLDAILEGSIVPADTGASAPLFQRLILSHADIRHWQYRQRSKGIDQVFLTLTEIMSILGVRKSMIEHLLQNNFLVKEDTKDASLVIFSREKLEAFRQSYVFLPEAAALLDMSPTMVRRSVAKGKIQPVLKNNHNFILLFCRKDISALLRDRL